jgi:hypothetical protein
LARFGTLAYRAAVLLLLGIIGWYLHGIQGQELESYYFSGPGLPSDTKVVPVYVINGIPTNRIEGHYLKDSPVAAVAPLTTTIDAPFGLKVRIVDQPVTVQGTH